MIDLLRREGVYLWYYFSIPLAASFSESGMEDDWLAAFMMSSILLNPQLIL